MDRDQGRRAGGVDRDRRAVEAEDVRDPAGDHAARTAREQVAVTALGIAVHPRAVSRGGGTHEHAGAGAAQGRRGDPGPLEQLPRRLEQQPLLRVHRQCLAGTDAEQSGVEGVGVVDESALRGDARITQPAQPVHVPATAVGDGRHGVRAVHDEAPQVLRRSHAARQTTAHRHDGDRLRPLVDEALMLSAQSFVLHERGPQRFDDLFDLRPHHELHAVRRIRLPWFVSPCGRGR